MSQNRGFPIAVLAGLLSLAGCVMAEPIGATRFELAIAAHGTTKRFLSLEAAVEGSGHRTVEIVDVTTIDDDAGARRHVRIAPAEAPGEPRPGPGHVEFATVAVRPIDLVVEFRGHEDIYHMSFPHEGGVVVEPLSGEFTHIVVRGTR